MCKILSWNVNGLNSPNKRKTLNHWLKKQKADIICLQEVHIRNKDKKFLENRSLGLDFHSLSDKKVKGVVFYINKDLSPVQIFSDSNGRYIAIEVLFNRRKTLLIGIYAPNYGKDAFLKELKGKIKTLNYKQTILLGDFNGVLDPQWDKSSRTKNDFGGKLPRSFFDILKKENLTDVWRTFNRTSKEFTFFSNRHKSYSRIDLILTSDILTTLTKKVEILSKILADHNPIIWVGKQLNYKYQWRINEQLLSKEENLERLKEETRNFLKINLGNEVAIHCVWDMYKAYMRGILMKMNHEYQKNREKKIKDIQDIIRVKELELIKTPNSQNLRMEIKMLQQKLQNILQEEIQKNIRFKNQKYFQGADKAEKLLASLIKKKRAKTFVSNLKIEGKQILSHRGIKEAFVNYFKSFYKTKTVDPKKIEKYLAKFTLNPVLETTKEELNKQITEEEVLTAIRDMKLNKTPGQMVLHLFFTKNSKNQLCPILKDLFSSIVNEKKIPPTWSEAYITLILKDKQDPTAVKSYRPISLLNEDYKVYAKFWQIS